MRSLTSEWTRVLIERKDLGCAVVLTWPFTGTDKGTGLWSYKFLVVTMVEYRNSSTDFLALIETRFKYDSPLCFHGSTNLN
jgi:hypothetical protein